jgi:hypothetical protein
MLRGSSEVADLAIPDSEADTEKPDVTLVPTEQLTVRLRR